MGSSYFKSGFVESQEQSQLTPATVVKYETNYKLTRLYLLKNLRRLQWSKAADNLRDTKYWKQLITRITCNISFRKVQKVYDTKQDANNYNLAMVILSEVGVYGNSWRYW